MSIVYSTGFVTGSDVDLASFGAPDFSYIRNTGLTVKAATSDVRDDAAQGVSIVARVVVPGMPTGDQRTNVLMRAQSNGSGAPAVRCTADSCYVANRDNSTAINVYRINAGTFSSSLITFSGTWPDNADYQLDLKATGTNPVVLEVFLGGASLGTVSDSDANRITSGVGGLMLGRNSGSSDLFVTSISIDDLAGPTITIQPNTVVAQPSASVGFSVTATGSGSLTYQWQDNTGGSFANISGATSSTLTRTAPARGNAYAVRCVVTDSGGSANSDPASLIVLSSAYRPWTAPTGGAPYGFDDRSRRRRPLTPPALVGKNSRLKPVMESALFPAATGGGGTLNGATLTTSATILAGQLSAGSQIAGQTLTATASLIAGQLSAGAQIAGQTLTASASILAGQLSAGAEIAGQTLTTTASLIAGSFGQGATIAGQVVEVTASIIAGALTAGSTIAGQTLTVSASLIAGALSGGVLIAGQVLTVSATLIGGAFSYGSTLAGQIVTAITSLLPGLLSGDPPPAGGGFAGWFLRRRRRGKRGK